MNATTTTETTKNRDERVNDNLRNARLTMEAVAKYSFYCADCGQKKQAVGGGCSICDACMKASQELSV